MALLNYTTKIEAIKTAGEISGILVAHGAKAVLTEFGSNKEVVALSFKIITPHGEVGIRLPIDADATLRTLEKQWQHGKVPRHFINRDQAARVAWRIVKDWVEAQMAILDTEMVKMEEIFLPYLIMPSGQTLYESMEQKHFYIEGPQT